MSVSLLSRGVVRGESKEESWLIQGRDSWAAVISGMVGFVLLNDSWSGY